jgi:hypothetical protein
MNTQDLINLIDIALIDGKLDEMERKVLYQNAISIGMRTAELESLIESRRLALNSQRQVRSAARKCPSCQAVIHKEMMTSCEYCGASLTATLTSQKVDEFHSSLMKISSDRRHEMIKSYPLPTEKNEVIAFLSLATPLGLEAITISAIISSTNPNLISRDDRSRFDERGAWLSKTQALIANSRAIYADDVSMQSILDKYEAQITQKKRNRLVIIGAIILVLSAIIALES